MANNSSPSTADNSNSPPSPDDVGRQKRLNDLRAMPGWLDFEELMDEQIARCLMALETATADNLLTLQCFTKSLRSVKEAVASAVQAPTYAQARNQFKAAAAGVPLQF